MYYRYETFKIVLFQKCYSYTSVPLKSTNPLFSKVILVQNIVSYDLLFNCIRLSLSIPICEVSVSGSPYQTSTVHMQQVYINNNMLNACNIMRSYSKHILQDFFISYSTAQYNVSCRAVLPEELEKSKQWTFKYKLQNDCKNHNNLPSQLQESTPTLHKTQPTPALLTIYKLNISKTFQHG